MFFRRRQPEPRDIYFHSSVEPQSVLLVRNVIRNQKYSVVSFVPLVLFNQFKYFFNLFFLLVAVSQFFPPLKVGFLFTYVSPLALVLGVTLIKEGYDDIKRYKRDKQENSELYIRLTPSGREEVTSSSLRVGDVIILTPNRRIPADCILLKTSEKTGASFIRTDQLDGETDWKLRHAIPSTQALSEQELVSYKSHLYADPPQKDIYDFIGTFKLTESSPTESLSLENTLWANTVLASGTCTCVVVYTGKETRSAMNSAQPVAKSGLLDAEINKLSKMLGVLMVFLSACSIALKVLTQGYATSSFIYFFRFLLLLSSIIPISMRVNLDMGKTVYSLLMMSDKKIGGTVVRSSGIPEELGRIEYFFTDKTGTLTQNEMVFKKLHLGHICFNRESLDDVTSALNDHFRSSGALHTPSSSTPSILSVRAAKNHHLSQRVSEVVFALGLCHNVTPVYPENSAKTLSNKTLQAASPDEVALVKFSDYVGLELIDRDLTSITLQNRLGQTFGFEVLYVFPFTSDRKRMGIIVKDKSTGKITFYMKGADVVMAKIVVFSEWLDEEVGNMARDGLRTLVFSKKDLSENEFAHFSRIFQEAKAAVVDRQARVNEALAFLEKDMELLAVSGVEDKLQENVRTTLELLRNANVKVWMLTGDKVETGIAVSAKLAARSHTLFQFVVKNVSQATRKLDQFKAVARRACLIIDGTSLSICLESFPEEFISVACLAPAVVCCRCSPQQKADVVSLVKKLKKKSCLAIGDGNNDVPMIQAADFGIGIEGKEGKQAALAADISVKQFSFVSDLMFWHGRNSYRRSARLAQFVIHRGLIISFIQCIFSLVFFYSPLTLFNGWLLIGYSTYYTMFPVFSLILDEDVDRNAVITYPELYRELQKGRLLSGKTFAQWCFQSLFQAAVIMIISLQIYEYSLFNISSITFTSLILIEILNLSMEMHKWHYLMVLSQLGSIFIYAASIVLLHNHFDLFYIVNTRFAVNIAFIVACAFAPVKLLKSAWSHLQPEVSQKLQ
ncbi:hypothetical protein RCL1_005411 [Eukaryota sp. TZLM3-RCL]